MKTFKSITSAPGCLTPCTATARKNKFPGIAATLLSCCAAAATTIANAAPVNLVQNSGFEVSTVTHSTELPADSVVTGSILPSWSTYTPGGASYSHLYFPGEATTVGSVCCGGASTATLWAATTSPGGGNFVALDGDATTYATISQQISGLTVGQQYTLSFDYAGGQFYPLDGATTEAWEVHFGAAQQTTPILSNASHGFTGWFTSQMSFVASASSELLSFMSKGTTDGLPPVTLLDNVSLTANESTPPNDVPEPASLALFALGLVAIAATRRSRGNPPTTLVG
jgi:hypothetical protein